MDKFNMIYDPNTMTKHSLYSNYGRNLLKKMLSSYKSGGGPNFPKAPPGPVTPAPIVPSTPSEEEDVVRPTTTTESPTPPLPSGPPTLMPSGPPPLIRSGPTTLMPSGPPTLMPSGPPTLMPSGPPTLMPSGPPTLMPSGPPMPTGPPTLMPSGPPMPTGPATPTREEVEMGPPRLYRIHRPGWRLDVVSGVEEPITPTPPPFLPGQPPLPVSYPNRPRPRPSEAQLSQDRPSPRSSVWMMPASELIGRGYSLDPSQPRIGGLGEIVKVDTCPDNQLGGDYFIDPSQPRIAGLGEIVKVDTCPDNQLGGDYFIDPSQPAIAGRPEVVGYKPCNHEPPIPDVADATNEIPQEVQDGGSMKKVSEFVNSVINKLTGKKDVHIVNPEVGVEAVKVDDDVVDLPEAEVVEDGDFDPARNHPADPRFL